VPFQILGGGNFYHKLTLNLLPFNLWWGFWGLSGLRRNLPEGEKEQICNFPFGPYFPFEAIFNFPVVYVVKLREKRVVEGQVQPFGGIGAF